MAFYAERFRREDEEDIWEELKRMLMNPIPKEEMTLKQQQEQAKIDATLEKMFPSEVKKIKMQEPYLKYEDLLADSSEYQSKKISLTNPQNDIASKFNIPEELKEVQPVEEFKETVDQIKTKAGEVLNKDNLKKTAGAGLQVASLFPSVKTVGTIGKVAGALGKKLAPKLGRKVAQEISEGVVNGATSGALEGLGRGVLTDEDLVKTTLQDAAIGGALGGVGGTVGGQINHVIRKKNLDDLVDKRKDWGIAFTKQSGKPKEAIDKLLEQKQGFVPKATKKKGIGDIDFVWGDSKGGMQHIIERRNSEGINGENFVREIPDGIKNGDKFNKNTHKDRDYIKDNEKEIVVKKEYNRKPRNWIVSSYKLKGAPSQDLSVGRALEQTYANGQQIPPLDLTKMPKDIIPPSQSNLNPANQQAKQSLTYDEWLEELKRKRKKRGW